MYTSETYEFSKQLKRERSYLVSLRMRWKETDTNLCIFRKKNDQFQCLNLQNTMPRLDEKQR